MAAKKNVEKSGLDPATRERMVKMGWIPVGGGMGDIHKWSVGAKVEGRFCGVREGSTGHLFDIEVKPGEVEVWSCPKALEPRLSPIALGTILYIECVATKTTQYNNEMFLFEIFAKPAK